MKYLFANYVEMFNSKYFTNTKKVYQQYKEELKK